MTEFLHQVIANREHIQEDMLMARIMRDIRREAAANRLVDLIFNSDPWERTEETSE